MPTAKLRCLKSAITHSVANIWEIPPITQKIKKFLILDGGAGYSSAPSVTVTDPNATTLGTGTASIGNGVISRWTYV